jgi:hypothetical protein
VLPLFLGQKLHLEVNSCFLCDVLKSRTSVAVPAFFLRHQVNGEKYKNQQGQQRPQDDNSPFENADYHFETFQCQTSSKRLGSDD